MRVLSIDPALRNTGYAVVEQVLENGRKPVYRALTYDVISNKRGLRQSSCLVSIRERLHDVIQEFRPDVCAVEGVIFVQSFRTAITMGAARGAAMIAAAEHGLEIFEYAPRRVKQAVVGRGAADKQQVAFMIRALLQLRETPPADAADALAIGMAHLYETDPTPGFRGSGKISAPLVGGPFLSHDSICKNQLSEGADPYSSFGIWLPSLLCMKIDAIRKVIAVQAVEQCDPDGEILSDNDLREAAAIAGAPLPKSPEDREINSFLEERADLLSVRALSRFPKQAQWLQERSSGHRFGVLALVLIVVACLLGFLSNELGPEDKINILSFPLLGILGWSLVVSIREVFLLFRNRDSISEGSIAWIRPLLSPQAPPEATAPQGQATPKWEAARTLYLRRWTSLTLPSLFAKIKILLHTVALALAISAIAGMYLKGLANEYRAVWESTFFDTGESLRPFLSGVLGPAAALLGDEIPSADALDHIHWKATDGEVTGENAARWIHWYALTIFLFVILPRGLFVLLWQWKDSRFRRTLPYRRISPNYFEHLIAISSGNSREFTLVPYGLDLGDGERRAIEKGLETFLEGPVDLTFESPVAFGEEDDLAGLDADLSQTSVVPLFNFASTPEKETHLELLQSLEKRSETPLPFLLLDATDFDRKSAGLGDAEQRRKDRKNAWEYLLSEKPLELVILSALTSTTTLHGEV